MDQARLARAGRQRWVDALGGDARVEFNAFQRVATRFDRLDQRVLQAVQRCAAFALLLGGDLAHVAQQRGELAVAAEHRDADRVPGAQVGGGGERGIGLGLKGLQIVGHGLSHMQRAARVRRPDSLGLVVGGAVMGVWRTGCGW